jgi:hypothetical protein
MSDMFGVLAAQQRPIGESLPVIGWASAIDSDLPQHLSI